VRLQLRGIFFGFASGYIGNGVSGLGLFVTAIEGVKAESLQSSHQSLIVSILSCGTFFGEFMFVPFLPIVVIFLIHIALAGALMAGDLADFYGRRPLTTIIIGCLTFKLQASSLVYHPDRYTLNNPDKALALIVAGRLIFDFGLGHVSVTMVIYMSEICPRKVRGALVSAYQFCITVGILLASVIVYASQNRGDTGQYRSLPSSFGLSFSHSASRIPSLLRPVWQDRRCPSLFGCTPWSAR